MCWCFDKFVRQCEKARKLSLTHSLSHTHTRALFQEESSSRGEFDFPREVVKNFRSIVKERLFFFIFGFSFTKMSDYLNSIINLTKTTSRKLKTTNALTT